MRKISFIMAALALVLGVTQCKKENKPVASGETQRIVLTASNGNDGSKVAVNAVSGQLNLTWEKDDEITVSGAVEGTLSLTGGAGEGTATFEGSVTRKEGDKVAFSLGANPTSFEGQIGNEQWIHDHPYFKSNEVDYNPDGVYGQNEKVPMQLQYAVLKLDLSAFGTEAGQDVTIKAGETTVATVTGVTTANKLYYVAMPLSNEAKEYTFRGNGIEVVLGPWTLAANTFYTNASGDAIVIEPDAPTVPVESVSVSPTTLSLEVGGATQQLTATILPENATNKNVIWSSDNESVATVAADGTVTAVAVGTANITVTTEDGGKTATCVVTVTSPAPTAPEGALPGLFSISDDKQVYFSKGNLQYVKTSSTWKFAANQYETVEYEWQYIGEDYEYQDIVGLFGWGTSGWNNGNIYYEPCNTHYLGDDEGLDPGNPENPYRQYGFGYGPKKDGYCGFDLTNNYDHEFAEADWGVHNAIVNGGNEAGIWRTLSKDEWYYLFDEYGEHEARRGKYKKNVTVNGVNGFLIAPDDWDLENYSLQSEYNETSSPLTWEAAEAAGLVFLPAAGYREGTYFSNVNQDGYYWSSSISEYQPENADIFYFADGGSSGVGQHYCFRGAAVRLVSDVKN